MKKAILFLLVICGVSAKGQKLKDLLYSGKLKSDSNTVVRKTDDLSSKIDTSTRKPAEAEKKVIAVIPGDSLNKTAVAGERTANAGESAAASTMERPSSETMAAAPETTTAPPAPAVKTPNRIWKEYTDSLTGSMKGEVLSNKKVKKETYFITVNYEIDVDGAVTVTDIAVAPENGYLQDQLKQRILLSPPVLSPVVDSSNKPRKVKRRYNFTIVKD